LTNRRRRPLQNRGHFIVVADPPGAGHFLAVADLKDIVGLYVDPPDHAVVLSVDEKRSHGERIATDALAE
jgi:hypothetical protein